MVEVFKTNVHVPQQAALLIHLIQTALPGHKATFDLDDNDRILRVECEGPFLDPLPVIGILTRSGFHIEVLSDICLSS